MPAFFGPKCSGRHRFTGIRLSDPVTRSARWLAAPVPKGRSRKPQPATTSLFERAFALEKYLGE